MHCIYQCKIITLLFQQHHQQTAQRKRNERLEREEVKESSWPSKEKIRNAKSMSIIKNHRICIRLAHLYVHHILTKFILRNCKYLTFYHIHILTFKQNDLEYATYWHLYHILFRHHLPFQSNETVTYLWCGISKKKILRLISFQSVKENQNIQISIQLSTNISPFSRKNNTIIYVNQCPKHKSKSSSKIKGLLKRWRTKKIYKRITTAQQKV